MEAGKLRQPGAIGISSVAVLAALFCGTARADQNVSLQWNANSDTNTAGYYLYPGTSSTNYLSKIDVGNNTTATISGLPPAGQSITYYFAATAYDSSRMESPPVKPGAVHHFQQQRPHAWRPSPR